MHKRIIILLLLCTANIFVKAQAPQGMDFQSIIRDSKGNLVTNQAIGLKISILKGGVSGIAVYSETHNATTNNGGLVTVTIGKGTTSDDFSKIEWGNGTYFAKIEVDVIGGTNYTLSATNQMLSVPYALYANYAGNYTTKIDSLEQKIKSIEQSVPSYHADGFSVGWNCQVSFAKGNVIKNQTSGKFEFASLQHIFNDTKNVGMFAINFNGIYNLDNTTQDLGLSVRKNILGNWRTLSINEWMYLINSRRNATQLWGYAQIDTQKGLIILPDGWINPSSITFTSGAKTYATNTYTNEQWKVLEDNGAVFLPAHGFRYDSGILEKEENGYYATSTIGDPNASRSEDCQVTFFFAENNTPSASLPITAGYMLPGWYFVRLVQNY